MTSSTISEICGTIGLPQMTQIRANKFNNVCGHQRNLRDDWFPADDADLRKIDSRTSATIREICGTIGSRR